MSWCCCYKTLLIIVYTFFISQSFAARFSQPQPSLPFIWPLPAKFSFGNETLSVDPKLSLIGNGASSPIVKAGFDRFRGIVFSNNGFVRTGKAAYDVNKLNVVVHNKTEEVGYFLFLNFSVVVLRMFWIWDFENLLQLQLGVDESYNLLVTKATGSGKVTIEVCFCFWDRHLLLNSNVSCCFLSIVVWISSVVFTMNHRHGQVYNDLKKKVNCTNQMCRCRVRQWHPKFSCRCYIFIFWFNRLFLCPRANKSSTCWLWCVLLFGQPTVFKID